jgi:hypothetical protein
VRIFKDKWFSRFARQNDITDRDLCDVVARADRGLIDADLGGGVIKQRIPRPNEGRSGGYRTIILFRTHERAFFVFGFAKNERDNISKRDLKDFRDAAEVSLALSLEALQRLIDAEMLFKVTCDENIQK